MTTPTPVNEWVVDPNFTRGTGFLPGVWHQDVPRYGAILSAGEIREERDLLTEFPTCWPEFPEDQSQSNSCVGNAVGTFCEHKNARKTGQYVELARGFVYYEARAVRGWQKQDSGALISDAYSVLGSKGICLNSMHPFYTSDGAINVFGPPSQDAYRQALRHRLVNPRRIPRESVLEVLNLGEPVVGGFKVYRQTFFGEEAQRTGFVRKPRFGDIPNGAHALCLGGYSRKTGRVWGPNSWGPNWGRLSSHRPGWFELDMDYVMDGDLGSDFCTGDYVEVIAA